MYRKAISASAAHPNSPYPSRIDCLASSVSGASPIALSAAVSNASDLAAPCSRRSAPRLEAGEAAPASDGRHPPASADPPRNPGPQPMRPQIVELNSRRAFSEASNARSASWILINHPSTVAPSARTLHRQPRNPYLPDQWWPGTVVATGSQSSPSTHRALPHNADNRFLSNPACSLLVYVIPSEVSGPRPASPALGSVPHSCHKRSR